jgi:hypothetical protein
MLHAAIGHVKGRIAPFEVTRKLQIKRAKEKGRSDKRKEDSRNEDDCCQSYPTRIF